MEKFKDFILIYILYMFSHVAESFIDFGNCTPELNIDPVEKMTINSIGYPDFYDKNSTCRYKFTAPLHHIIKANCTINVGEDNEGCTTGYIILSRKGDILLRDSYPICGSHFHTFESFNRSLVLAVVSMESAGKFICEFQAVVPQLKKKNATSLIFPYMVVLRDRARNDDIYCRGTIISHRYILTVAHCTNFQKTAAHVAAEVGLDDFDRPTNYSVTYDIEKIIVHPLYAVNKTYDVALLKTTTSIEWSVRVSTICLPPLTAAAKDFNYTNVYFLDCCTDSYNHNLRDNEGSFTTFLIHKGNRQYFSAIRIYNSSRDQEFTENSLVPYLPWIYENTNITTCNAE